ncbi:hypothetical protein AL486_01930 [Pandoraea apista]|uniref:hypothetical protein n=1 Tax=Pandoraea apista TaxID=93218 RepID=UPI000CE999E2|nr:hypothetical protein [Pandoraea apista]AVF38614.1 hypothetical protein AL486_01930 [Pandoraea apista]
MHIPLLNWVTNALAISHGVALPHQSAHAQDMTAGLRQVAMAPASAASQGLACVATEDRLDWSRAPTTRAQVFAERLMDVRSVCVRGSRNDAENCLLDLPPDTNVAVRPSHLMLAGCEASLPAPMRTMLARQRRDSHSLERAFSETFAAESQGKFSVASIEARLTQQLGQMSPDTQRMLRHADTYVEVPQLAFLRVLSGEQEARRHHVAGPFPNAQSRRSAGVPEVRDAMLGAYIRTPAGGRHHSLFVSLATPSTVQQILEDTLAHAAQHVNQLFGEVPDTYMTARMQMRAVGPGEDIVHTLAELLHDGHQRFGEFARGETREALAPESHAHVRQQPCQPGASTLTFPPRVPASPPAPAQPAPQAQSKTGETSTQSLPSSRMRRAPRAQAPSIAEMQAALAKLERLAQKYSSLSRPRYG